jgi:hypothetical protein
VFGNVGHQLGARLYMDNLRMESEDLFLVLLPEARARRSARAGMSGATNQLKYTLVNKLRSRGIASGVQLPHRRSEGGADRADARARGRRGRRRDAINRCSARPANAPAPPPIERRAERAFRRLSAARGRFAEDICPR